MIHSGFQQFSITNFFHVVFSCLKVSLRLVSENKRDKVSQSRNIQLETSLNHMNFKMRDKLTQTNYILSLSLKNIQRDLSLSPILENKRQVNIDKFYLVSKVKIDQQRSCLFPQFFKMGDKLTQTNSILSLKSKLTKRHLVLFLTF